MSISARMESNTDPVELRRLCGVALALGVLAQIVVPLIHGYGRTVCTLLSVVALFAAAVLHALSESVSAMLMALAVLFVGGLIIEAIGSRSGLPFGSYEYSHGLGWRVLGVPLAVPMAWMMMGWPAFVAGRKVGNAPVIGTAILVTWDLLLDPQMVKAGYWRWESTSWPSLNGIPIVNTVGWVVVAGAMMFAMDRLVTVNVRSKGLPLMVLAWTWFASILGSLVFGLSRPAAGLVGGVAMTVALAPVALRVRDDINRRPPVRVPGTASSGPRVAAGGPPLRRE